MADDSHVGPDAAFEAAVSLHQEGRHEDAADAYRAILEETPHHAGARTNLAQALGAMGRVEEAEAAYRAILDDEPRAHQVGMLDHQ